jgi:hypothetical protein
MCNHYHWLAKSYLGIMSPMKFHGPLFLKVPLRGMRANEEISQGLG